tara:strand:+ start:2549 stop:5728 length:3180 start_codon:yes stop_codon:yes gene_type:complete
MNRDRFINKLRKKYQSGGVKYNTMDKIQDGLTLGGLTPGVGIVPDALNTGISAIRSGYNYLTGDTARSKSQMGDLALNAASMIPGLGQAAGITKLGARGAKVMRGVKMAKPVYSNVKKGKSAFKLAKSGVDSISGSVTDLNNLKAPTSGPGQGPLLALNSGENNKFNFGMNLDKMQTGGMYDQMNQYQKGGLSKFKKQTGGTRLPGGQVAAATTYAGKAAHLLEGIGHVAPKIAGNVGRVAGAVGIPLMLADFYQRGQRLSGGKVNVNQKPFLQNAINSSKGSVWNKQTEGSIWKKQNGGAHTPLKRYQEGGQQLPGGEMQPIPGSDAVQFNGASHDQGGIMLDGQTEVEGGETMDKVNMAKKGGKRDYFFSSFLKKGGKSFANMHKDILRNGGDQEEINMLAKMQEVAAGRNPKKVAKLGGVVEYKHGGLHKYETGGLQEKYNAHEAKKPEAPTFNLESPGKAPRLFGNANSVQQMMYDSKMEKYQEKVDAYNAAKAKHEQALQEYKANLAEWSTIEDQLGDEIEAEQMMQDEKDAEEAEKKEEKKAKNDALVQEAKDLGIDLPKSIRPSEIKILIDRYKQDATLDTQRKGEESFLPGTSGVPENQPAVTIGGKKFYLDDPQLQAYMEEQGENFDQTWMDNVDSEVLEIAGITSFSDLQDTKKVKAYQNAYNNKYSDNKIKVDGKLGEETLNTGISKAIEIDESTLLKEVPVNATTEQDIIPEEDVVEEVAPAPAFAPEIVEEVSTDPQYTMITNPSLTEQTKYTDSEGSEYTLDADNNWFEGNTQLDYDPSESGDLTKVEEKKQRNFGAVPTAGYLGMAAGLIPAAYAYFHKQPAAEQANYTQGFNNPVIAQRGKSPKLERYDYNQDIANVGSEVRGMNKYIETSGGGPANMVNKMMAFNKGNDAKMKIRASETRANIGVQNTEAQLEQQMNLDNMKRAQSASIFNAQMSRAETARMDQVDEANTQRRQKRIDDMEYMKYSGMSQLGQSLQQGFGDILDYKADMAKAAAIGAGSGNVYKDSVLYQQGWRYNPESGQLEDPNQKKKFGGLKMLQKYKK